jgi:acyl transferase domain-containing protein/surfactin synthase thioesterase subunit/NADPH-dependent curcumin reductase CurA/NADP-dependent 3-hydroxy acid dehydrogenase YdfG/aryl carrier-like protein
MTTSSIDNSAPETKEAIAIVGIGCHTPGKVNSPEDLWRVLLDRIDGIGTVPADRWNVDEYYDPNPDKAGKIKTNRGGFIEGIDLFDNEFFNIFPKEAERIDPQQRLLLQTTYEALEDAGDTMATFRGSRTAVYMGVFMNDYWDIQVDPGNRYSISPHVPMGASLTSLANRISYLYNLKGPSVSIDTACSSSLVSVHLACQSIWRNEADAAMAGGVNIMINPESTVMMSKGNFLSPDGLCKSFDEKANGYVRSEGVGIVYLKPLAKALSDGNKIYGLIRGSSCNSDGFTPEGFTVPSPTAQTVMLEAAYRDAGVDVNRAQFIEAHGTGTPVGDPLETRAFANVFGHRPANKPLLIGSVKSNVGHLEGAAGVTGLIKLALCMHNKVIPGNLHFNKGNPKIDFENWRLKVVDKTTEWPTPEDGSPRVGGVNSFGAGGTNAHAVLEEYVPSIHGTTALPAEPSTDRKPTQSLCLFTTSAQTEEALKQLLLNYKDYLASSTASLSDVCFNAGKHRSALRHRLAIVAADKNDFAAKVDAYIGGNLLSGVEYCVSQEKQPKLGFVFTGQGPQWHAMGRELIEQEPLFRDVIHRIEEHFFKLAGWSLLEEMSRSEADSKVSDTRIAQPAIMAIQIALVELWKLHGVKPQGVVGHSIGEVAAAYTAGALTLEQAVQVIYHRSRGQHQATGKGLMLAVSVSLAEAEKLIADVSDIVSIGAVNGPESVTLSGDEAPLRAIAEKLEARDIFNRFLKVNVPFHSHHMEPLKEELITSLQDLVPAQAKIPLYSTVTGKQEDGTHLLSNYWYDNVREPVYFSPALEQMVNDGFDLFVEVGPHPALTVGAEELFTKLQAKAAIYPSIRRKEDELLRFMQTLGALHIGGLPLDWLKLYPEARRIHDLPRYPWQLSSFWFESRSHREHRLGRRFHPHLIRHQDSGLGEDIHAFEILLDRNAEPYMNDHRVDDIIIFPATGHLELATAAARKAFGESFGFLEDVNFESGLFLPDEGEAPDIRLEIFSAEGRYWLMSRDRSNADAAWTKHSNGRMNCLGDAFVPTIVSLTELQARINDRLPVQPMYNDLKQSGLYYGTTFRAVQNLWTTKGEILGKVCLHESLEYGIGDYLLHPSVLDACLHTIFAAKMSGPDEERGIYLPVHIERYKFFRQPKGNVVWSYVRVTEASAAFLNGDFVIIDEDGETVAEVQGLRCKYIAGSRKNEEDLAYSGCYEYCWQDAGDLNLKAATGTEALLIGDAAFDHSPLLQALTGTGLKVITMGEGFDHQVNLLDRQAVQEVLSGIKTAHPSLSRIIVTLPMGLENEDGLPEQTATLAWKLLNVNNAVIGNELQAVLWFMNRHSELVLPDDRIVNLAQSPVFGLTRVMTNEYPMVIAKVVDLGQADSEEFNLLAAILASTANGGNESEFAIRGERLFVKRLERVSKNRAQENAALELPADGSPYEAFFAEPGILDSAQFRRIIPAALAENDVEIAVKAAALNFKDVLNGMGLLSAESVAGGLVGAQLGLECSGVVTRVGSAVSRFKPGDEVLAIAPRSIAGIAVTPEHCLVHKPAHLTFEEAATITIVYLTAYYCLYDLARIEAGERLLIHSGTGGVGIAAIRLAQMTGAEIFATAGSESKRQLLRDMGISHVYDSRKLDFYDQIMNDTAGQGVDVVLNSLSGKAIVQSVKSLRPFGRFVEIGKTDIYNDASLHLKRFGENLSYFAVDVDRLMAQKPVRGAKLFAEVIRLFEERRLEPHPFTAFPVTQLPEALDYIAKGRQIGKVVVSMEGHSVRALPAQSLVLNPDKTYLVTGGASGFGIELAKWLAEKGARKLVLISRSGPKTEYDNFWIEALQKQGVKLLLPKIDLGSLAEVQDMAAEAKKLGPIGGLIHGAAILQDSTIQNMDRALFDKVFEAKAIGAWNLHKALEEEPVDFFLSLSSISSVFGLPGQSNYSAANNFLDKLVQYRQLRGLKAQSVDLGVLGQYAGMSREGGNVLNVLENQGWLPLSLGQVTAKIERILLEGYVVRMAANIDWLRFREFFGHLRSDLKFAHLLTDEALNLKGNRTGSESLRDKLQGLIAGEAERYLIQQLTEALARILGATPDKIDPTKSVSAIGLDSLMMNQLRNWILQKLEINYPLMRMAKGPSIVELSAQLREELTKTNGPAPQTGDTSGIASEEDVEMVNGWFVHRKSKEGDAKKLKLFMFHSMGAGASMFAHFLYNPPLDCDVYCIQLPGRENRSDETAYTDLQPLLRDLETAMLPLLDGDFAIYGHSYGGIIAFETSRLLRRKYGKHPVHLFASATMAPQMTLTWKNRDVMRESTISSNSEQKLIGLMSYIDDLDFVKKILPGMRRDMPLLMGYDYQEEEPLPCPITVFSAIEDEVTLPEEMTVWKEQTSSRFRQELVHGDHWFVSRNKEFIGVQIAKDLAEILPEPKA